MDDSIPVGRHRFVGEDWHPFAHPLCLGSGDFANNFLFNPPALRSQPLAHGINQRPQCQLGIRQDRHIRLVLLVEVFLIRVDVDELDAFRNRSSVRPVGQPERVAHGQDRVGLAVHVQGGSGSIPAARVDSPAQGQGMVLGKHALSQQRGRHRHRQHLGQFADLFGSSGAQGSSTGI